MDILIDTNFIKTCVKEKVDFFELEKYGRILLPEEVIEEFKKLSEKSKGKEKYFAELCLDLIESNKNRFKFVELGENYVDKGIIDFVDKKKNIAVATLDKELKRKVKDNAKILTLKARKRIDFG